MNLLDIVIIGGVGLGVAYFFNVGGLKDTIDGILIDMQGHGDPACIFDDKCRFGNESMCGTPRCQPCC